MELVSAQWYEKLCQELTAMLDPEGEVQPLYNRVSCHLLGEEFQVEEDCPRVYMLLWV